MATKRKLKIPSDEQVFVFLESDNTKLKAATQTEMAKQSFLDKVLQLHGVSVHLYGGRTLDEQSIRISVPDLLGDVASQVRQSEIQVRRKYRNVQLHVEIGESGDYGEPEPISLATNE